VSKRARPGVCSGSASPVALGLPGLPCLWDASSLNAAAGRVPVPPQTWARMELTEVTSSKNKGH